MSEEPQLPPPPPKLDTKRLWWSLLTPAVLMATLMLIMIFLPSKAQEHVFLPILILVGFATIFGWIAFGRAIVQRFQNPSQILLILAYPIGQLIILFTIFFCCCLVLLSQSGFH